MVGDDGASAQTAAVMFPASRLRAWLERGPFWTAATVGVFVGTLVVLRLAGRR
jgi:hypothetical protein